MIPIRADKVKYRNIIERNMTITGCKCMNWIIRVRLIYDTGLEYNFFREEKRLENLKKKIESCKILLHGVIWLPYHYTRKNVLISYNK